MTVAVAHTWYIALQKIVNVLTLGCGLLVVVACSITTYNGIRSGSAAGHPHHENETQQDAVTVTPSPAELYELKDMTQFSETLRKVVIACAAVGILAGALQSLLSACSLFSCSKKISTRTKVWLFFHVIIFCVLLVCILMPYSFKQKEEGQSHSISGMASSFKMNMEMAFAFDNFKVNAGLNFYNIVLVLNEAVVLFLMILNCCFMRCGIYEYESLENDSNKYNDY